MSESNQGASPAIPCRHFYIDPLAAAWMARHFGMRFFAIDEEIKYLNN